MEATVRWVENRMFLGESGSGHTVVMDGPATQTSGNKGIRPMEMILLGIGGCSSYDVVEILEKGRHDVQDCVAQLTAERADTIPSVFTKIHLHFVVTGHNLKADVVNRAIKLSAEKYCSASIMLGKVVDITHDFEIIEV